MPNFSRGDLSLRTKLLLEGEAQSVVADTRRFFSRKRIEHEAVRGERERVGREVHDGALQALTAVSLQLGAMDRLIGIDPRAARDLVANLQHFIGDEQRALRLWLAHQNAPPSSAKVSLQELVLALRALCLRAESQWGLQVEFRHLGQHDVAIDRAEHCYRIVQESLANVGKHARAANARVQLEARVSSIHIVVKDDGVGFPLRGRHDLASLQRRGMGPRSLMQRVASLEGEMWLTSDGSGAILEFSLPTPPPAANRTFSSA